MNHFKLIPPTHELVKIFNSFWTSAPIATSVKLFEDDEEVFEEDEFGEGEEDEFTEESDDDPDAE